MTELASGLDSNIIASIIGALIGAFLGAISAFLLSEYARSREIQRQKIQKMKDKAAEEATSLRSIQKYVVSVISQNLLNTQVAKDIGQGIISEDGKYAFSLTIPMAYPVAHESDDFINSQLFFYWEALGREVFLQNQAISTISGYYDWLRKASRENLFTEGSTMINKKAIEGDNRLIVASMESLLVANQELYDKAILVMAHIRCYVEYRNTIDIRDENSIQKLRKIIEGFESFKPSDKKLAATKKKLEGLYIAEKMFHEASFR